MDKFLSWMLPPGASTFVGDIDSIYYWILVVTGVAFVVVEVALVVFLIRYRKRPGRKADVRPRQHAGRDHLDERHGGGRRRSSGSLSAPAWDKIKGREWRTA